MDGLSPSTQNTPVNIIFGAKINNANNISTVLKALTFQESAVCFITHNGLKLTVEDSKCVQANAFIQSEIFQNFTLSSEDPVMFSIKLNVLLDCLNIFGRSGISNFDISPALKMCFQGHGHPLNLILEESGIITECSINTSEAQEVLDFNFIATSVTAKIIMKSECLKDVFMDLDASCEVIEIKVSPAEGIFQFSTKGNTGLNNILIRRQSDLVEAFNCSEEVKASYKLSLLKLAYKALQLSQKVSLRINDRGMLCLQFMIKVDDGHICFVEFFCCPEET